MSQSSLPRNRLLTVAAAGDHIGVSTKTLRRRIAEGELPAYRIGPRAIRVRLEDVEAMCRRIPTGDVDASPAA